MQNLEGLNAYRRKKGGRMVKLNIGYVIVSGNHEEIYHATELVKNAGADMIRFKCDITGKGVSAQDTWHKSAFGQIEQAKADFHRPPVFSVHTIHSLQDMEESRYADWQCEKGCLYQYFVSTIGSDGNLYMCDHNTMPGGIPLGNVINKPFKEVWMSDRHRYLANGVKYTCQSSVCPPFGNRINAFLHEIDGLRKQYGTASVISALDVIRAEIKNHFEEDTL
jgi:MoaA/NifB/PqqE/SkfB family radical SAM enzyme